MCINKAVNDDELILKLEERLDTNTMPELEAEMVNIDGIHKDGYANLVKLLDTTMKVRTKLNLQR